MNFRFSKAELCAQKVLLDSGIEDPSDYPIENIILGRKAFYKESPLNGKDGEIVSFSGKSIITINSNILVQSKKRFAAAHELGHYELHRNLQPVFSDSEEDMMNWFISGSHEKEANEFASELLMPSNIFKSICDEYYFDHRLIKLLSEKFKVSKTAALLKFFRFGNHPICLVYCKNNKMQWFKVSDDFKFYLEFEKNKNSPENSVANELFISNKIYDENELSQEIWQSTWFKYNEYNEFKKFYEYCLNVKSYNYSISVIWTD